MVDLTKLTGWPIPEEITYKEAAAFCLATHTYLPKAPPRCQIIVCLGFRGRKSLHTVVMLGQPVSPKLSRSHYEVRRMISDGKLYSGCSKLYLHCAAITHGDGRSLVTYTFSEFPPSVLATSETLELKSYGKIKNGYDYRLTGNRQNLASALVKYKWEWPNGCS